MDATKIARPEESHVVFLAQYLPLHFVSTMRALARRVGKLTLLLSEPMDQSRDWQPEFSGLNVEVQKSLRCQIRHRHPLGFEEPGRLLFPYSTIPDLLRLRPDVVIAVEAGPRTLQAACLRALGADFRLIVQMRESESTARSRGWVRGAVRRWLLPRADRIFVNGRSGRNYILGCGADPSRVGIVPSGTDTVTFGHHPPPGIASDGLELLYVGQLIPRKGLAPFVRALARAAAAVARPVRLALAGRGPDEALLRGLALPPNLQLRFLGSVPYSRLPALYATSQAFVMPSLADEWGLVVNEAMASGLPVFGSRGAQAVQELVLPGHNGWTYDPEDPADLAAQLPDLLAAPPATLREMGAAARRIALQVSDDYAAFAIYRGIRQVLDPGADALTGWTAGGISGPSPDGRQS